MNVLAMDLGGTKLAAAVVNAHGDILAETTCGIETAHGPHGLISQMADLANNFLRSYPDITKIGVASAGPLDPRSGTLLDPTNLTTNQKGWGQVPLAQILAEKTQRQVVVENDAAAAVLAEHWMGRLAGVENGVMITLGTGVGIGVIINHQLLRSGRHLHPEVSHISLNAWDRSAPCGCGNLGCIEAYLSGRNFTQRLQSQWQDPQLTGEEVVRRAKQGDSRALAAFAQYAEHFALAVNALVVLFAPEVIAISGGFSASSDLFMPTVDRHLEKLLVRRRVGIDLYPRIVRSRYAHQACLLGAAYVALN